jgi:hypothetical protein
MTEKSYDKITGFKIFLLIMSVLGLEVLWWVKKGVRRETFIGGLA